MKNFSTSQLDRNNTLSDTKNIFAEIKLTNDKSVKVSIETLSDYLFDRSVYESNKMYNLFDVVCSPANIDNSFMWSLNLDSSATLTKSNKSAPNWLYGYFKTGIDPTISDTNQSFWDSLIYNKQNDTIRYEVIPDMSDGVIASSQYMLEFNTNGFTNRFLICESAGYVALPCFNNTFLRCAEGDNSTKITVNASGPDAIKNHTHTYSAYYLNPTSSTAAKTSFTDYVSGDTFNYVGGNTQLPGGSETVPNNIQYNMYMCIKTDISPKRVDVTYVKRDKVPIGAMFPLSEQILNNPNYLICDGGEYKISEYLELFNKIGYSYCSPANGWLDVSDRAVYFRVPDMRGRYVYNSNTNIAKCNVLSTTTKNSSFKHFHGIGTDRGSNNFYWSGRVAPQDMTFRGNYIYTRSINYSAAHGIGSINLNGGSDGTTNEIYTTSGNPPVELVNISLNYIIKAK